MTPAVLSNIQEVQVTNLYAGSGRTVSLLNADAVEVIVNDGSLGDLVFSNVGDTLQAVGVENLLDTTDTTVTFASTAGVTELDLAFNNVAGGTVTIANVETVNVFSEVEDSTTGLELAGATALTFTGDANLTATLTVATNGVSSVDASAMDGDLNLTFSAQTQVLSTADISVLGGNGNDTFTVSNLAQDYTITLGAGNDTVVDTNITVNDSIVGGDGFDTLSTTDARADALSVTVNGVDGIDQLSLTDRLAGDLNVTLVDSTITEIELAAATTALNTGAENITGAAGTFVVELGTSRAIAGGVANDNQLAGNLTITDTGSATTDELVIVNYAANSATNTSLNVFNSNSITSAGYENVTIVGGRSVSSPTEQVIGTLTVNVDNTAGLPTAAASVTVVGNSAVHVDTSLTTNSTGLLTVDASNLNVLSTATGLTIDAISQGVGGTASITGSVGADTVVTGNFASTVYGGTGNDVLTGGTKADQLHGEAGNDTLTGSGGNDTIRGGEGNDVIDSTVAGVVSIDGGAGNDTVSLAATLAATDVVSGGEGVDTLSVTAAITGTTGVGVTNFEVLRTTADQAMTNTVNNTGWTAVQAAAANVDITNALAAVTTFYADRASAGASDLTFARLVDTGTDSLTIATSDFGNATQRDVALTSFTANDEETITLDVSAGLSTGAGTLTITTLNAADLTSLTATGDHNVEVTTLAGATGLTTLTNSLTAGTFTINAGVSTSAVTFTANGGSTGRSTVTTGSGADVITASLAAELYATGGAGNDVITGGNLADSLTGGAGADTLTATAGADTLTGGSGSDTIVGGTDLLSTYSAADLDAIADGGTVNTTGVVINLGSTTLTAAAILTATGTSYTANGNTSVAANTVAYLDNAGTFGVGLSTSQDSLSNIRNVIGSAGEDYIVGSSSADTLSGAAGADTISGGSGNDVITGGTDADQLTGGAGVDTFTYAAGDTAVTLSLGTHGGADATASGYDTITDFALADGTNTSEVFDTTGTAALGTAATYNFADFTVEADDGAGGQDVIVFQTMVVAATGVASFTGTVNGGAAGTLTINVANLAGAINALNISDIGDAGATVGFVVEDGAVDDAVIFTQAANAVGTTDNVVSYLDEVALVGVTTTSTTTTTGYIYVA